MVCTFIPMLQRTFSMSTWSVNLVCRAQYVITYHYVGNTAYQAAFSTAFQVGLQDHREPCSVESVVHF